jgi:hypothetical protein
MRSEAGLARLGAPSYHHSFHEHEGRAKGDSRQGSRSFHEDRRAGHSRDRHAGQAGSLLPSSRRSSVEQERELRSGNMQSGKYLAPMGDAGHVLPPLGDPKKDGLHDIGQNMSVGGKNSGLNSNFEGYKYPKP